jgi:hypothetical protein
MTTTTDSPAPRLSAAAIRRIAASAILVTTLAVAVPASAAVPAAPRGGGGSVSGAEFERITGNIRAAIQRHDMRAYHAFGVQLRDLVAEAVGG